MLLWSTTVSSIGGLLLGILILARAKRQAGNLFFALVSILISLVIITNYFSLSNKDSAEITLFWIRAVMFFVPYLMVTMFYFCSSYLNTEYKFSLKKILYLGLPTVILSLINITPLVYKSVEISNGNILPLAGPAIALNALHIMPLFILSILNMAKNSRKKSLADKEKFMIKFSLYLLLFSFGIQIITSFVIVAIFHYTALVPLGNFLSFIFVILMTVSIFYFQAFNLNLVGAFFFAAILIILMFAEIFTATGIQTVIYKIIVFMLVSVVGFEFIKSVKKEIQQKEELQILAKKLDEANRHLEDLDEQKDNFISMASHELNTPIAAIEGYLSMIIDEKMAGQNIDKKAMGYLQNVYFSSKRLAALVRDMLNVSRIESNRIHLVNEEAQIEKIIEQAIAEIKIKADEVGHKLTFEKPKTLLPKTWLDVPRTTEVIINILGNAIKYTDPPGKIIVRAQADDGKIVVSVEDNGRGIPKDKEENVFQKFSQVEVLKDQVKGTGLGMFITKNLVELAGGKVWFKSSVDPKDHGTTFYFSLPIHKTKPADPHEGEGALFANKSTTNTKKESTTPTAEKTSATPSTQTNQIDTNTNAGADTRADTKSHADALHQ